MTMTARQQFEGTRLNAPPGTKGGSMDLFSRAGEIGNQAPHDRRIDRHLEGRGLLQRKCACGGIPGPSGECEECRKKREAGLRRLVSDARPSTLDSQPLAAPPIVHEVLRSPGQALDAATREFMEPRFGHDFSGVRVHTGAKAAESARSVDADAYTVGRDIVFGPGRFEPQKDRGRRLLAHELTHVVQQGARAFDAPPEGLRVMDAHAPEEARANRQAESIGPETAPPCPPQGAHPAQIMRQFATPATAGDAAGDRQQEPKCGPDVTDWFVRQVNAAMTDPEVLGIQRNLRLANRFAGAFGLTANDVAEAGGTAAILNEERSLGANAPARNPTINSQLAAGGASAAAVATKLPAGVLSSPTTISPLISPSAAAGIAMAGALGAAALSWRNLVNHAARYDFKAHPDSMNHPRSAHCPDEGCPPGEVGIVTLCPGAAARNCYESDLPGNLFYALIGRHAGWSELTLQLGSQYAELTDVTPTPARPNVTWDTPDDTAAISLGFRLPLPLSRSAFCSAVPPARGSLAGRQGCADCPEAVSPRIR
jgi:hypothetical protein